MQEYNLNEGLSRGALDYLIQPLLSIDEYESKISDKRAIVVGFFVGESAPAKDLSNFIDRGNQPTMDTEISPSPTPEGYYVVFVEIERSPAFPNILMEILKDVKNLTDIEDWAYICPEHQDPQPVSKESLTKNLVLDPKDIIDIPAKDEEENSSEEPTKDEETDQIKEDDFWKESVADGYELTESYIVIHKHGQQFPYAILQETNETAIRLTETSEVSKLQHILGPNYIVWAMGDSLIVEHDDECRTLSVIS